MKLINMGILVGKDGLFSKRGCPGNCQHCNLWTEDGCRVILEAPTVDAVEVVHSGWILNDDGSGTCKHCHRTTRNCWDYDSWMNYCPDCGARMDGGNK
jgi:hypothetical protein